MVRGAHVATKSVIEEGKESTNIQEEVVPLNCQACL